MNNGFRGERGKLSDVKGIKNKIEYIWEYYKIHIIVGTVLFISLVSFIRYRINYQYVQLTMGIVNGTQVDASEFESEFIEYLGLNPKKNTISVYNKSLNSDERMTGETPYKLLDIYIAAGQLNVAFCDEKGVEYMSGMGGTWDLYEITTVSQQNVLSEYFVEFPFLVASGLTEEEIIYEDRYVAIDLSQTSLMEYFGLDEDHKYMVISNYEGNEENMVKFLNFITEYVKENG